jgi:hypothetical protein
MLGTCAHGLGEYCLKEGFREVPEAAFDTIIWLDANEDAHLTWLKHDGLETAAQLSAVTGIDVLFMARVDEKMRDGVQLYLDVVWEAYDEMGAGTEIAIEERFDLDWLRPGLGGTADCVLFQFLGKLVPIDYKNGYVAVEAEDNTQALCYGLGAAHKRDWAFEEMEVVIVQPNSRGQSVKRWPVTLDELRAFQDRLAKGSDLVDEAADALAACEDETDFIEWSGTYLSTGEDGKHCTFCDALAVCPQARARAEELAVADFNDDPPEGNPLEVHDDASLERLVQLVKWGKWLDRLVKAAETLGQRRLEQGLPVPGHKLVLGKTNRKWLDEEEVKARFAAAGFAEEDCVEPPKPLALKSPAQMEKLGQGRSPQRKLAKELTEELSGKPPGKLTMASEDDPREAVEPGQGVLEDFVDDVEGDYG